MNIHLFRSFGRMLRTASLALALVTLAPGLNAQVPVLVNYQGRVAVDSVNFQGAGLFKFALVNEAGDTTFWSNDGTSTIGDEPAAAVSLAVVKGLYSALLGDAALANMAAIPTSAFANPDVRLRVWFDDGVKGSQLLTPDQRLAPGAYLADGAVTTTTLADGAVSGAKVAPATIDGTHVAAGSLDFSHLFVPAAPGAGQVLGFDGTSLIWSAPSINAAPGTRSTSISSGQGSLSTTVAQVVSVNTARRSIMIRNHDASISIYVGPSGVSTTTGVLVKAGESISIFSTAAVFAIAASGTPSYSYLTEND